MESLLIVFGIVVLLAPEVCKVVQEFVKEEN